jgi:LPS-assembly protein
MNNGGKISLKYVSTLILTLLFFCMTVNSSARYSKYPRAETSNAADSIPKKNLPPIKDTVVMDSAVIDTLPFHSDSVRQQTDSFHVPYSKDSLDAPIAYTAEDSVVLDMLTKNITLYNHATTKYKDIDLSAYNIRMDQPNNLLLATFARDTSGAMMGRPVMNQAETKMESDSMVFNMKTQRGITINTFTQSGEMYVMGEKIKKISKNDYYAYRGRFTTCNLDTPHFAFITNKMKLINQSMAITGPVHPEFEGVPIPIYIPFGYFPISQGRHSGFLAPTFDVSSQYGLGLDGIGYYKVVNDYFDVAVKANIYSYGGYNLYFLPEYRVRYRYSGHMYFVFQNTKILSNSGKDPYIENQTYSLNWAHTVDSKAHPGQNFSANVNYQSTKFNQYNITSPTAVYNNQITSSIAFSKTFDDGKYNLTLNANHNQDNLSGLVNINAPSVGFTAITIYPFSPKDFVGTPKWYQKLGVGLTSNITGHTSFYDSVFSFQHMLDTFQYGMQNTIPITLALPQVGFLQITPGVSFQNQILNTLYGYKWDTTAQKVDTSSQKGIYFANSLSFSLSLSTAIFGTFQHFGKNSKILGIRHTMRPMLSFSYSPDLSQSYYQNNLQITTTGQYENRNRYAGNVYSGFSPGVFGGVSFGLDNNIEMKVKSKTDTTAGANDKIKLIDGFGFTGSYNYLADSFKLSPINIYLRSTLFKNINLTASSTLNPYKHDTLGFNINQYAWSGSGFNLGRIIAGNIAVTTSFRSKPKDPKKEETDKKNLEDQMPMTIDEQQAQLDYIRQNPAEFVDFNISWSVNISYSLSFSNTFVVNKYETQLNSAVILNGDFNLTEKWKMGFNCYYDVRNLKMQSLTTFLSRDMHCWQLTVNVTPVGYYRSFNITINPKSSILRDLHINRNRTFY